MNRVHISERAGAKHGKSLPCLLAGVATVAVALVLSSAPVFADPVRIVTSGGVYQIPEDGETGFDLFGSGFVFSGDAVNALLTSCGYPCTPGSSLNLSATMTPYSTGSATVDGQIFASVYYTGTFNFDAGSVIVPSLAPGEGLAPGPTTNFTFSGTIAGYADPNLSGAPLFSAQLIGQGLADVDFFNFATDQRLHADGFDYRFAATTATTPEPGSLLLLGSGAAWIGSHWRRRRHAVQ